MLQIFTTKMNTESAWSRCVHEYQERAFEVILLIAIDRWDGSQRFNDLWRLDTSTWQWTLLQPSGACHCSADVCVDKASRYSHQPHRLVWLTPVSIYWEDKTMHLHDRHACACAGQLPPARADHVATMWHYCDCGHWKDILVVHGGSSAAGLLGDIWTYDVDTNRCAVSVPWLEHSGDGCG